MVYKYINLLIHPFMFCTATAGNRNKSPVGFTFPKTHAYSRKIVHKRRLNQAAPSLLYCIKFSTSNYHEVSELIFTSNSSVLFPTPVALHDTSGLDF